MTTKNQNIAFRKATEMSFANSEKIQKKSEVLIKDLISYLKNKKPNELFLFEENEEIYIPDLHGDFVHMILTLHNHGLLDKNLSLKNDHNYIFLGDIYDRCSDADVVEFWINTQIRKNKNIFKLLGNHELVFLLRNYDGYPIAKPAHDAIKDASNDFQITENILKAIADGSLIAAYVSEDPYTNTPKLFIHSYVILDDFLELGLSKNSDIFLFAEKLNERLQARGKEAYEIFLSSRKNDFSKWDKIRQIFEDDFLFNGTTKRNEINTSFLWRRTGVPKLKVYPMELDVEIPDNVYQIVGHTTVFSFKINDNKIFGKPFVLSPKTGSGKIQFSDVGIGYYYKEDDFSRPEVCINRKFAVEI